MNRLVAVLALLVVASAYRVRRDTAEDLKTKITNAMKQVENIDEMCASLFDENAKFINYDGKVLDGQTEICDKMKGKAEMFKTATAMDYTIDNLIEEGDLAIAFATTSLTFTRDGNEVTENMKALTVFKKVDGDYTIIVDGVYKTGHHGHHHNHRARRDAMTADEKLNALYNKVKGLSAEGKLKEIVDLVYADDIKMFTDRGKLIEGKEAVLEYYQKKMAKYGKPEVEMERKHLIEDGDLAIVIGEKKMSIEKDGETKTKTFTFITVFKAEGDSYQAIAKGNFYVHEHAEGESSSQSHEH